MSRRKALALFAIAVLPACTFDPLLASRGTDASIVEPQPDATITPQPDATIAPQPDASEAPDATDAGTAPDADDAGLGEPDATEVIDTGIPPDTGVPPDAGGLNPPIPHLASSEQTTGTADVVLAQGFINTDNLTIPEAVASGASFLLVPQSPGGPMLAVLRVRTFTVPSGVLVRVVGEYPLLVAASDEVIINGVFDASARDEDRGAGGSRGAQGDGRGGDGATTPNFQDFGDSGGGGGGFGTSGAPGGFAENGAIPGGGSGNTFGDDRLTVLVGGSGGGRGGNGDCMTADPGAGGGAVQLYSSTRIEIGANGFILASGGGGGGGQECMTSNAGAGSGGGSGGAIYLIAPQITHAGTLAANGGGGGGGGSSEQRGDGGDGADGSRNNIPAPGGNAGGFYGRSGGSGATRTTPAIEGTGMTGTGPSGGNGGAGGGGLGRIVLITAPSGLTNTGAATPEPFEDTY